MTHWSAHIAIGSVLIHIWSYTEVCLKLNIFIGFHYVEQGQFMLHFTNFIMFLYMSNDQFNSNVSSQITLPLWSVQQSRFPCDLICSCSNTRPLTNVLHRSVDSVVNYSCIAQYVIPEIISKGDNTYGIHCESGFGELASLQCLLLCKTL